MRSDILKVKLDWTPRRIALEFLDMDQQYAESLDTFNRREADLRKEIASAVEPKFVTQAQTDAQQQVLFLIQLYVSSLIRLKYALDRAYIVAAFVAGSLYSIDSYRRFPAGLTDDIRRAYREVYLHRRMLEEIEQKHFHTTVMPDGVRSAVILLQLYLLMPWLMRDDLGELHSTIDAQEVPREVESLESSARQLADSIDHGWTGWLLRRNTNGIVLLGMEFDHLRVDYSLPDYCNDVRRAQKRARERAAQEANTTDGTDRANSDTLPSKTTEAPPPETGGSPNDDKTSQ